MRRIGSAALALTLALGACALPDAPVPSPREPQPRASGRVPADRLPPFGAHVASER